MVWERIVCMMRKEFIELFRDPRMRGTVLIPPLLQLLIFGYTVNLDIENSKIAFMDQDRSPASRELVSRFQGSPRFDIVAAPQSEAEVQNLLDRSQVVAVIRILPNFERAILRGEPAPVQILRRRHQFQHWIAGFRLRRRSDRAIRRAGGGDAAQREDVRQDGPVPQRYGRWRRSRRGRTAA